MGENGYRDKKRQFVRDKMSIFQKLFVSKRPTLKKKYIPSLDKVAKFVIWFIKYEPISNAISNRSSNIIFNEGYRPKSGIQNNPETYKSNINSLSEWFFIKIYLDLNMLKDANKNEFRQFIDSLDEASIETLTVAGEIATKYNMKFENIVYEKEIEKIPHGKERDWFKINFLADNVLAAEIRILAWLYHEYFREWYQLKENRND